jgi:geranylgeranyl pyrophosphate synthase
LNLGTAFQLIDDLLDFTSTEDALGKAAGADLMGGKVTLPLIFWREAEPAALETIRQVLSDGNYETTTQHDLVEALKRTNALERARDVADEYAENARAALDVLPDSDYSDSLRSLPSYVLNRDR